MKYEPIVSTKNIQIKQKIEIINRIRLKRDKWTNDQLIKLIE